MGKFIPILRVGRYKDASGRNCDITPQVLTDIVESYESKSAPLVKGHPNNEAPAMGWIDKLKIVGNELQASFCEVTEEFKAEVERSAFKNISASFFMPLSDSNPSKGKHCLRHVGVLGASRPAIPNLGTLQEAFAFCEEGDEILCVSEFEESAEMIGFFEKLLKSMIEKLFEKQIEEIIAKKTTVELSESPEITVRTHRFSEGFSISDGTVNFAESIEHTAVFADEVDKLCQSGMDRIDAYKQAKMNLS